MTSPALGQRPQPDHQRLARVRDDVVRYRRHGTRCPDAVERWDIRSFDEAYAVQQMVSENLAEPVVGWKAGAIEQEARDRHGLAEPFIGRVFQSRRLTSPARLPAAMASPCMLECELACEIGSLPETAEPYTAAQVAKGITAWRPCFEVVDFTSSHWRSLKMRHHIADNGGTGALVVGPPIPGWRDIRLDDQSVELRIDGTVRAARRIARTWDDLIEVAAWLANILRSRGMGSVAHGIVATGTLTGMTELSRGERAVADFRALGQAVLVSEGTR